MPLTARNGRGQTLGDGRTRLMGILNLTPDSFSDGGRYPSPSAAVEHALAMVADGAAVIDIGGESTRPGHQPVPAGEQIERTLPVLAALRPRTDALLSIDTTRAEVAAAALDAGADWVNDTSALADDPELAGLVAARGCPVVLMHRFRPPRTSTTAREGEADVVAAIVATLAARIAHATACGIERERIVVDPGIGFGTLPGDNATILAQVDHLAGLAAPRLVGPSRKSFLGHLTGQPVGRREWATCAAVTALALAGVELVRVHDVAAARDAVLVAEAIRAARAEGPR